MLFIYLVVVHAFLVVFQLYHSRLVVHAFLTVFGRALLIVGLLVLSIDLAAIQDRLSELRGHEAVQRVYRRGTVPVAGPQRPRPQLQDGGGPDHRRGRAVRRPELHRRDHPSDRQGATFLPRLLVRCVLEPLANLCKKM